MKFSVDGHYTGEYTRNAAGDQVVVVTFAPGDTFEVDRALFDEKLEPAVGLPADLFRDAVVEVLNPPPAEVPTWEPRKTLRTFDDVAKRDDE